MHVCEIDSRSAAHVGENYTVPPKVDFSGNPEPPLDPPLPSENKQPFYLGQQHIFTRERPHLPRRQPALHPFLHPGQSTDIFFVSGAMDCWRFQTLLQKCVYWQMHTGTTYDDLLWWDEYPLLVGIRGDFDSITWLPSNCNFCNLSPVDNTWHDFPASAKATQSKGSPKASSQLYVP